MQVIHRFNGFYPFSLEVESEQTFLEVLKENLTQQEIAAFRKRYKILKAMDQTNLVKLVRIYKEQSKLHLLYEYFPLSLEKYVQIRSQTSKEAARDLYKSIYEQFLTVLTNIIDQFVKFQIRTDIIIQSFVIADAHNTIIKLFVDPDAEFIALNHEDEFNEQQIKCNRAVLQEFYQAERKRILMEVEELLEKCFGKNHMAAEVNRPNFIINGSKLVFINNNDQKNNAGSAKPEGKKPIHSNSPVKTQKSELKRDLKEKTLKKLTQIKGVLNRYESKTPHNAQDDYKFYPQGEDEIIFRPEEITNDKTALLEQNQYLQSLENEIEKINEAKKIKEERENEEKMAEIIKQITEIQEKNKKYSEAIPKDYKGQTEQSEQTKSTELFRDLKYSRNAENMKTDCNSTKNDTKNNDRSGASANSEESPAQPEERKEEKPNKYKMTIITSHEIEIEGSSEPQLKMAEKDVIEGIKSGKLSITDAPQKPQRPKTVKYETEESRFPQKKGNLEDNLRLNSRNSDIASKSKKINEIIEKINSKSNINSQLSNSSHQPEERHESKPNVEADHPQDNYFDKIREAKSKAEQVLKDYAKKKQ